MEINETKNTGHETMNLLSNAIRNGEITEGHEIRVERLPIYGGNRKNAMMTEYTKTIEAIEIMTDYLGDEQIEIRFKGSKIDLTLGYSKNLGQEIMAGGSGRGSRRFGLLDF